MELVADLVAIPSVSGDEAAVQDRVVREMESMGLSPDVWEPDVNGLRDHPGYFDTKTYDRVGYEDRQNVVARVKGTEPNGQALALSGHADVVDVDTDEWTYDPWDPTVEDGRLYGRGACDMKGWLAANLFVFRALQACDVSLRGDLLLQSTIDEEAGGTGGVLAVLNRGYQPDAAVIAEPFGVPNIGIASAGVRCFQVTVPGKSAHAAYGFDGVNAITEAVKVLTALERLDAERKARIDFEPAINRNPRADGAVTNLNVGTIEAGDWPSTVPPTATFECRIGWPPGESRTEIVAEVEETIQNVADGDPWLIDNPPRVEWFGWDAEPHECRRDAEIVQTARDVAATVCDEAGQFVGGLAGLDERFYTRYYNIQCPTVGPRGDNLHGADEYVELDSLVETAKTNALTALSFCGVAD